MNLIKKNFNDIGVFKYNLCFPIPATGIGGCADGGVNVFRFIQYYCPNVQNYLNKRGISIGGSRVAYPHPTGEGRDFTGGSISTSKWSQKPDAGRRYDIQIIKIGGLNN